MSLYKKCTAKPHFRRNPLGRIQKLVMKIDKLLSSNQNEIIEQAKFYKSPFGKSFRRATKNN